MEQKNRSAIVVLARAGYTAKEIVKLTKLPKVIVYCVLNDLKRSPWLIENNTRLEVIQSALPGFSLVSNARLKPIYPHPLQLLQRNGMWPFPQGLELPTGTLAWLAMFEDAITFCISRLSWEPRCWKLLSFIKYQSAGKALVFVGEKKSWLWTLWWIAEILGLLDTNLLTSHMSFRLRILPHWWYSVPRREIEVSWIHNSLQLVWRSILESIGTSWRPLCYRGWSGSLDLTIWCWFWIQHQVIPPKQNKAFLMRRYYFFCEVRHLIK